MSIIYLTIPEFKNLISESVKEEFQNVLKEQKENPTEKTNKLLTRNEVCKILGVSLPTLHDWSLKGIVPSYRISSRIRFKEDEIMELLKNPRGLKYQSKNGK